VRLQGLVEPCDRAERGVFAWSAVERVREHRTDALGTRAVDLRLALLDTRSVQEYFERNAQVRVARIDDLADAQFGGNVVAVLVVHPNRFGIAVEVSLHFKRAAVFEGVTQDRRVTLARPRPPGFAVVFAAHAEERGDDCGFERGFAGFVRTVDDREARVEDDAAADELSEAVHALF